MKSRIYAREVLKRLKITPAELAEALGLEQNHMTRILRRNGFICTWAIHSEVVGDKYHYGETVNPHIKRIKRMRECLNMSQRQFALALKVSPSYLGRVESNKNPLTDKFKRTLEEFFYRNREKLKAVDSIDLV